MKENKDIKSALTLRNLVFEKIEFLRTGFRNSKEVDFHIQTAAEWQEEQKVYRVILTLKGDKPGEYTMEIVVAGYFGLETEELNGEMQKALIRKNSVAILMPYLRSEVSLLTAQPGTDCVVLPPFNIHKMLGE